MAEYVRIFPMVYLQSVENVGHCGSRIAFQATRAKIHSIMDVHTPAQRSFNMSRVRSKNTGPEMLLRHALHSTGLRYRIHGVRLPGKPDIIFTKQRAVIFVHGCFWHGHDCPLFRLPATRSEFWKAKISGTQARDTRDAAALASAGWRVLTVWECALRGSKRQAIEAIISQVTTWLQSTDAALTLTGLWA